jgi:hypothetical protein
MDWEKFNYSTIGENILDRFFNEGHVINTVGDYNDLLKLPKVFNDEKEETKTEIEIQKIGIEESKGVE